jgi:dimethylaniline monooxygenase (N-oxide forming)
VRKKRFAVIGAGPAGLVTAKTLLRADFEVQIFEKGSFVGGIWVQDNDNGRNFVYDNLCINTSKRLTEFGDFPFRDLKQKVPSHKDMALYMHQYAEHFGLLSKVEFRTEVLRVTPSDEQDYRWCVECSGGRTERFDSVAVCSGVFARPGPPSTLLRNFIGNYLHAAEYREPSRFLSRRVCVVGAGNSAADIASDLCASAARVVLVARSPVFVVPHFFFGLSTNDIARALQRSWIPDKVRSWVMRLLVRAVHGDLTEYGFKPLTHRVHATISSSIIPDICFGRVSVKNGIEDVSGSTIVFDDGTSEEFDDIVAATGYITEFPFLSPEVVEPQDNKLQLFKRIVPPGHPGLYFIGMINLDTPINFVCERQARWIVEYELGTACLPDEADMRTDIANKDRWVQATFGPSRRHSVQEDSRRYYCELAQELDKGRRRANRARSSRGEKARFPAIGETFQRLTSALRGRRESIGDRKCSGVK